MADTNLCREQSLPHRGRKWKLCALLKWRGGNNEEIMLFFFK